MRRFRLIVGAAILLAGMGFVPVAAELQEPEQEWTVNLDEGLRASLVAYPSGEPDSVVVGTGGRVVRIDGTGQIVFDVVFGPEDRRGDIYDASVADLNGDGVDEIIGGHNAGLVAAFDGVTGEQLWEYDLGTPLATWRMATPADLDGDGTCEVLAANMDGWLTCLSHKGKLLWRSKLTEYRLSTPSVGDIDNDGAPEIVYGSATRHLVALDAQGQVEWDAFLPPHHLGRTAPLIADTDGDGRAEIHSMSSMIKLDTGFVCVNGGDGSLKWEGATWHKAYGGRSLIRFSDGTTGVLACDKGNNLCAYDPEGALRWRTRIGGRGIWTPPVVADLDGDGAHEIAVGSRDYGWTVLNVDGEVLGVYSSGGYYGGGVVADIDRDGILELVFTTQGGDVTAYSFGGPARPGAVVMGDWRGPRYPMRNGSGEEKAAPQVVLIADLPEACYGDNPLRVALPEEGGRLGLEVATTFPDDTRQIQVFYPEEGKSEVDAVWPVSLCGRYHVGLRLLDLGRGAVLGEQHLKAKVRSVTEAIEAGKDEAIATLQSVAQRLHEDAPDTLVTLMRRAAELQAKYTLLSREIEHAPALGVPDRDAIGDKVRQFQTFLDQSVKLAALIESEVSASRRAAFVMWQDDNPWDNLDPLATIPARGGDLAVDAWAFGNETESVAVNLLNISSTALTLRVEPGKMTDGAKAEDVATLHRAIFLPTVQKETVPDVLPKIENGFLVDLAPGECRQIWINLDTTGLEPGAYELAWPVRTMDPESTTRDLTIRLDVSPATLPEESRFLAGYWSRNELHGESTVADLNEHLQTLWYGIPLPGAQADAKGNLVGEIDWSAHDKPLHDAKQVMKILYGGQVPVPGFPEGVEVTEELRLKGQRSYFNALVDHLAQFGLDHTNVMFYIEDETGLSGSHENYLRGAKRNKAVDPRVQNYANPWGGITIDMIRDMEPYTDVWQPGMETIEYHGEEYVRAMRGATHKPIAMYTPPGDCRVLRPPRGSSGRSPGKRLSGASKAAAGGCTTRRICSRRIPRANPVMAASITTGAS